MARTVLTVQARPGLAGATPTYGAVDAVNGNSFVWPGVPVLIHTKSTDGSPHTMTVKANAQSIGGLSLADKAVTVPATTGDKMIVIDDAAGVVQSDGSVYLDFSAGTNHTIAIIRVD